jgi:flagellar assembly factor FliW
MKTAETIEPTAVTPDEESTIRLPFGLLGFERNKDYVLLCRTDEEPFLWLQMVDAPKHSFLVISPFNVVPDYQPDIAEEDVAFLGIQKPEDALVLAITTLHANGSATVNLKGPIVFHRGSRVGKQVIPRNAAKYPLQFALPVAA